MGDSNDGSSSAAQGALAREDASNGGFFKRIIGALSPSDMSEQVAEAVPVSRHAVPLVPGMLNLRRMRLEDVMTPSAEIISVPLDMGKDELVALFRDSGQTRLPVYDGTLDTPVGLVHLKDFALTHGFSSKSVRFNLKNLLRPLLYAPPSMPIGVLLQKMQAERSHMALVIDEYGGVDGLVTLEDLVEQVVGEIEDEHDQEEGVLWSREGAGCYLVEARAPLDEFEIETGLSFQVEGQDDDEVETLGGLVFLLAGRVPARGEVIVHPGGTEFEVVDADPRRIKRLRLRLPGPANG